MASPFASQLNQNGVVRVMPLSQPPNKGKILPRVALKVHQRKVELHSLGSSCAKQHSVGLVEQLRQIQFSNRQKTPIDPSFLPSIIASHAFFMGPSTNSICLKEFEFLLPQVCTSCGPHIPLELQFSPFPPKSQCRNCVLSQDSSLMLKIKIGDIIVETLVVELIEVFTLSCETLFNFMVCSMFA